jgi:phage tail sheath protein FI
MPGVVISTSVRTGPSTATVRESSQFFVSGKAERGPAGTAVMVESLAEFEDTFGGYVSYSNLHPTIESFFEEGGTRAHVSRVVGPGATVGTLSLNEGGVGGDNCITLTANGAGAWSTGVTVDVTHPTASTFKIDLKYGGVLKYSTGTVSSVSQAVGRINLSSVAARYITAEVDDATIARPETSTASALSAGDDDKDDIVDAHYVTSLEEFNDALGTGAVACADNSGATVTSALVAHANAYSRVAFLYDTENANTTSVKAKALAIQGGDNAEHAAIYYPWVEVPTATAGITRFIPPVGYAAGKRAVAHNQTGPHLPAAGLLSIAKFVTGTKLEINKATGDDLDENYVNAIRIIQNTVRIYGARSCSVDTDNFRHITQQDVVNSIVTMCYRSLEDLVFSTIDGRNTIFASIESRLVVILAGMRDLGALYPAFNVNGKQLDNGYTVKCDSTINPAAQLQTGLVKAKVGVRVSGVGDKLEIDIVKSNLTTSVV